MKIVWSETARTDLGEIKAYISKDCVHILTIVHMARCISDFEA